METKITRKRGKWTFLLLAAVCTFAVGKDVSCQSAIQSPEKLPEFEVATVKPAHLKAGTVWGLYTYPGGKVMAGYLNLKELIQNAFDVEGPTIAGAVGWMNDERYDITAIPPDSSASRRLNPPSPNTPPSLEQRKMLQNLLIERFALKFHRESREGSVYLLAKKRETT